MEIKATIRKISRFTVMIVIYELSRFCSWLPGFFRNIGALLKAISTTLLVAFIIASYSDTFLDLLAVVITSFGWFLPLVLLFVLGFVFTFFIPERDDLEPGPNIDTTDPDTELTEIREESRVSISNQIQALDGRSSDIIGMIKINLLIASIALPAVSILIQNDQISGFSNIVNFYTRAAIVAWLSAILLAILAYSKVGFFGGIGHGAIEELQEKEQHDFETFQNWIIRGHKKWLHENTQILRKTGGIMAVSIFFTVISLILFIAGLLNAV